LLDFTAGRETAAEFVGQVRRKRQLARHHVSFGRGVGSVTEAGGRPGFGLGRLFFPIPRWRTCCEAAEQARCAGCDLLDGIRKRNLIGLRWLVEARDLPHKLQRSCLNFIRRRRRIKIEKCFDVPSHFLALEPVEFLDFPFLPR